MHPIRKIRETLGSGVAEIAVTAPPLVKDAVIKVADKLNDVNDNVLEPAEQRLADEHGYTHGGKREGLAKHMMGVGKYESGAHFLSQYMVDPMRKDDEKNEAIAEK